MVLVPWAVYYGRIYFRDASMRRSGFTTAKGERGYLVSKTFLELFAVAIALVTSAALFVLVAKKVFPNPLQPTPELAKLVPYARLGLTAVPQAQLYICFAVPLALLIFFVQASIFVGLSSRRNEDADREWWGRGGALLIMMAVGLGLFSYIAVFGPVALYAAPAILASIGGAAGVGGALLGFSAKTPANQKEKEQAGPLATVGNLASALIVPLFVVFILAGISLGSTWLIQQIGDTGIEASQWEKYTAMQSQYSETTRETVGGRAIEVKTAMPTMPRATLSELRSMAHLKTIESTSALQLLVFLAVFVVAVALSRAIGVNKFSMHALYRNRLIRAYLGASRRRRQPDIFTGFDEDDNLQMWELRPELFWKTNFDDRFVSELRNPTGSADRKKLSAHVWEKLAPTTKAQLNKSIDAGMDSMAQNINGLLMTADLATGAGVTAPAWLTTDKKTQFGYSLSLRNRALLDEYYPDLLKPMARPDDVAGERRERAPMHVVNAALNLTTGDNLGWQQRMAESFTVSPFHTGSLYVGYRSSYEYGGPRGISVGTAVTISGAAASPNMGYHSSPTMAFLLTMFNVRLGAWLGNPGLAGQTAYDAAHPSSNLQPLLSELTGGSNDRSKWVYLSDGGHFENLGVYEMILRRCHYIVVSDAGADPKFSFEDLGNAIRKIRTDLGVPIDLDGKVKMQPRQADGKFSYGQFVATARIRYSVVDKDGQDGVLIYIKAGIYKNDEHLPRDVYNYAQESLLFPHEPTSDQFFSESQFESYRALGRHAINAICSNYTVEKPADAQLPILDTNRLPIAKRFRSIPAFEKTVRANIRP
jgi:hypothetical protein